MSAVHELIGRAAGALARMILPRELREACRRTSLPRLADWGSGGGHG